VTSAALPATVRAQRRWWDGNGQLLLASGLLATVVVTAVFPSLFSSADPADCSLSRSLDRPSRSHLMGYDLQGCDYLAVTLHGGRTSLGLAALVLTGTTLIALVLGSVAGYVGGRTDALLSRVTDVWSGIPLILGGVIVLSGTEDRGLLHVALVLTLFGWPAMFRVLRASVLEVRQRDYVTAAHALGARPLRVLVRHVLPNSIRPLLVFTSAYVGVIIAAEATLTFAGVGLGRPAYSWGIQLSEAQDRLRAAPHLLVFPGAFLVTSVIGCVLLGEALRRRASSAA